jgi:GTPase KRas protein
VQIDGQSCILEVLDTAGQEEYITLRHQWIHDGEGFVLVYSISSRSSFARIRRFHEEIQRVTKTSPVMLVGNKCDRATEREVSTQEGRALAEELGCDFIEASAKNCINVEKVYFDVVRQLRRQAGRKKTVQQQPSHIQYGSYDDLRTCTNMGGKSSRSCWAKPTCAIL